MTKPLTSQEIDDMLRETVAKMAKRDKEMLDSGLYNDILIPNCQPTFEEGIWACLKPGVKERLEIYSSNSKKNN